MMHGRTIFDSERTKFLKLVANCSRSITERPTEIVRVVKIYEIGRAGMSNAVAFPRLANALDPVRGDNPPIAR
jgi:hypothetical protein